jgi:hypothetical protein
MNRMLAAVVALSSMFSVAPTLAVARNNLNLIAGKGLHYGIVKQGGGTISVTLARYGKMFPAFANDNNVIVNYLAPGSGGRPVFDGTDAGIPVATAFPNGAYELIDDNHDLLASRGCLQQKAANNSSWDNARVYCDATGVETIKIAGSKGSDVVLVGDTVTADVRHKCQQSQAACGRSCLLPASYTCCDPTPAPYAACWVATGDICEIDPGPMYCQQ